MIEITGKKCRRLLPSREGKSRCGSFENVRLETGDLFIFSYSTYPFLITAVYLLYGTHGTYGKYDTYCTVQYSTLRMMRSYGTQYRYSTVHATV